MTIESIVFFDLLIIIFGLIVGLGVVVYLYIKTLKKLEAAKKEEKHLQQSIEQKAVGLLDQARARAFEIIDEANNKAKGIIEETKSFGQEAKISQEKNLEKVSQDLVTIYQGMLEELKKDDINIFKNISKDIEEDALKEIKDFRTILQKETVESQKIVEQKIEGEYSQAQKEVALYKEERIKKMDEAIFQVLSEVSKEVIGEGIDYKKHQELVLDALNQAKKDLTKIK